MPEDELMRAIVGIVAVTEEEEEPKENTERGFTVARLPGWRTY